MLVLSRPTESLKTYSCAFLQERAQKIRRTLARFFKNAPKKSARHSRVSSGTRPKNPRDTRAFLQERAQKIRETLARFFRNAPKIRRDTCAFLQERTQNSARNLRVSSGTHPKFGETLGRDTCAFLQERAQFGETLARFFKNASKN